MQRFGHNRGELMEELGECSERRSGIEENMVDNVLDKDVRDGDWDLCGSDEDGDSRDDYDIVDDYDEEEDLGNDVDEDDDLENEADLDEEIDVDLDEVNDAEVDEENDADFDEDNDAGVDVNEGYKLPQEVHNTPPKNGAALQTFARSTTVGDFIDYGVWRSRRVNNGFGGNDFDFGGELKWSECKTKRNRGERK